jgi:hypothetical protein
MTTVTNLAQASRRRSGARAPGAEVSKLKTAYVTRLAVPADQITRLWGATRVVMVERPAAVPRLSAPPRAAHAG